MEQTFVKYIYVFFKKLLDKYEFKVKAELNDGQSYMIEYSSSDFTIKIEKYFREFYVTLYKTTKPNAEVNLFNLLAYLRRGDKQVPKSDYFHSEKNIEKCYIKQFSHISSVVYDNYDLIKSFFHEESYELNITEFEKYWMRIHPEFYR